MDQTRFSFPPYTLPLGNYCVGNFNWMLPYYGIDCTASSIYDPLPTIHNSVHGLWVGGMDQKVIWHGVKLSAIGIN